MSSGTRVLSPAFHNLIGQLSYAGWLWFLTLWIMRVYGPEQLGRLSYVFAVVSPLLLFTHFQLRNRLAAQPELLIKISEYLKLRRHLLIIVVGISLLWTFSIGGIGLSFVLSVLAFKLMESSSELFHGVLHAEHKLSTVAQSQVIKSVSALLLMLLTTWFGLELSFFFYALSFLFLLITYFYEWRISTTLKERRPSSQSSWQTIRQDPHLIALGLMAWLISVNASWPRYLLEHYLGLAQLGHFTALFAIFAGLGLVQNAWLQGSLGLLKHDPRRLLMKQFSQVIGFHLVTYLLLKYLGQELVNRMFGRVIEFNQQLVSLLVASSLVAGMCSVLYYFLLTKKSMKRQWQILVLVNLVTVLSAVWFIPRFELTGAFLSLLMGSLIQFLSYAVLCSYELSRRQL